MSNTDTPETIRTSAKDIEAVVTQMVSDGKKEGKSIFDILSQIQSKLKEMGVTQTSPVEQTNPLERHQAKTKILQEQIADTEDSVEKARLQEELATANKILKLELQVIMTAVRNLALLEGITDEDFERMPP